MLREARTRFERRLLGALPFCSPLAPSAGARRVRGCARAFAFAIALAALSAPAARAADCFAPLAENDKWRCQVELSSGQVHEYCLNSTGQTGSGAERTFGMVATGPYPRVCTCGVQGKGARASFNAASSYLCLDASTDTAETGKITTKKLTGQLYNLSVDVRGRFSCKPDPSCVVQP